MMMYTPTTNMIVSRIITTFTIQWACSNRCEISRLTAPTDAAADESSGILPSIVSAITRGPSVGQIARIIVATALCISVHGCADVDGGAVELSWKLRPTSSSLEDKFVECSSGRTGTGAVTYIRLD